MRLLLLTLVLALVGCTPEAPPPEQPEPEPAPQLEPHTLGSLEKGHRLDDVYLAAQPSPEDFAAIKEAGIRTVVNLRHPDEAGFDEKSIVEELGMTYVALPFNGADELTDTLLDQGRAQLRDADRPLLLHCSSANRVGPHWIAWRVLDEGIPLDSAVVEAKTIGLRTDAYLEKARDYIGRNQE